MTSIGRNNPIQIKKVRKEKRESGKDLVIYNLYQGVYDVLGINCKMLGLIALEWLKTPCLANSKIT